MVNTIPTYGSGMFFLMKDDIPPIWETGKNIGGGMWTFKVSKKSLDKIWIDLIAFTLGNTLTKNPDDMEHINGISISPKINNCIVKIWNDDNKSRDTSIFNPDIEHSGELIIEDGQYRPHKKGC